MAAALTEPVEPAVPFGPIDHAVRAVLAGDAEAGLGWAGARLAAAPEDPIAPLVVGRCLGRLEQRALAARALAVALDVALDVGALPAAVAACAGLRDLGEDASPAYERVAQRFARGSRVASVSSHAPPALTPTLGIEPLPPEQALALTARAIEVATAARERRLAAGKPPQGASVPPLSTLQPAALRAVIETFDVIYRDVGSVLVEQGTRSADAFVVVRGELEVRRVRRDGTSVAIGRLGAGALLGEVALLSRAPPTASVVAVRPAIALVAGQAALDAVAERLPEVGEELAAHCRGRMVANLVRNSSLFAGIDASERLGVMVRFVTRTYEAGELLIAQSADTDGLHLVASGEVEVRQRRGAETVHVADLGVGEVVGEMGLVLRRPAAADVVARVPTVTLHLPRDGFLDLIKEYPAVLAELYDLAVRRDQQSSGVLALDGLAADGCIIL